ncbi:hypothetical protein [Noviherbaspirillum aerium]|uniref:hypothetical protein n=1 Tax=Noviherbaspirillum aerium TaxID=2588497 RepID=UPI00124E9B8D|nr:hypothetical protein [Noviherbaspirillum aerium]
MKNIRELPPLANPPIEAQRCATYKLQPTIYFKEQIMGVPAIPPGGGGGGGQAVEKEKDKGCSKKAGDPDKGGGGGGGDGGNSLEKVLDGLPPEVKQQILDMINQGKDPV